jgi:hypothetical protein
MSTIESKIEKLESHNGWSYRYYLVNELDESLVKITKKKFESGDLSSLGKFTNGQEVRIVNATVRTENRIPRILYELYTSHIKVNEDGYFNPGLHPSSPSSMWHLRLVMKKLFMNSKYGYLSSRIAEKTPLVREIEMCNIEQVIPNRTDTSKPQSAKEKLSYANAHTSTTFPCSHPISLLEQTYAMNLREIEMGQNIDKVIFMEVCAVLDKFNSH